MKVIVCDNFFRLSGESKIKQEKGRGCKLPPALFTADGNADRTKGIRDLILEKIGAEIKKATGRFFIPSGYLLPTNSPL